jgi:5S rRNA maturation endonuclease (ribonuclease M5)
VRFGRLPDDCAIVQSSEKFVRDCRPDQLERLGRELDLSVESLKRLATGRASSGWSFPMRDEQGVVIGIRIRGYNGSKFAVKGSHEGIFTPTGIVTTERVVITEGPTDAAALLDLGFDAIGRPSCTGGIRILSKWIQIHRPREVVVLGDNDEPGVLGAHELADALKPYIASVRVMFPPTGIKDARDWKRKGAKHEDIVAAIASAETVQTQISESTRRSHR